MRTDKNIKLVTASLMAAMTCITTMVIAVPSPSGGYAHPGDGFVMLCGIILGPLYGGLAAGIGSMLADLLLGYSSYALATFLIKCLAAVISASVYRLLHHKLTKHFLPVLIGGILGGAVVTGGYLLYESVLLGLGFTTALLNVPLNLVQNVFGIMVSLLLFPLLMKVPQIKSIMDRK